MRLIDADALNTDIEETIAESGCVNHEGEIMDCVMFLIHIPQNGSCQIMFCGNANTGGRNARRLRGLLRKEAQHE